jgi:hypothetical protein
MSQNVGLSSNFSFQGLSDAGNVDVALFLATSTLTKLKESVLAENWESIDHTLKEIASFNVYMRSKLPTGSLVYDELCTLIEQGQNEFVFHVFDLLKQYDLSNYPDNFLQAACILQLSNTDEFKNVLSRFEKLIADLSQNPNESLNQLKMLIEQKDYPNLTAIYFRLATYLSQICNRSRDISLEQAMSTLRV